MRNELFSIKSHYDFNDRLVQFSSVRCDIRLVIAFGVFFYRVQFVVIHLHYSFSAVQNNLLACLVKLQKIELKLFCAIREFLTSFTCATVLWDQDWQGMFDKRIFDDVQ